ncbi:MAG TPA: M67 family metallopeptidase [Anaerolineales bacterium]
MHEVLRLKQSDWDVMLKHVQACAPLEACGLLGGQGDFVQIVIPVSNSERSPVRFRMDPAEQLHAFGLIEERNMELVGIFHSHTGDEASGSVAPGGPSPTDVAEAAYPVVQIIWSRRAGQWSARGYRINGGRIASVTLEVSVGE